MRQIVAGEGILRIGKNGEQDALEVSFPIVENWVELYGASGAWELSVQRAGDETAYSADIAPDAESVRWIVSDVDVSKIGEGRCELAYKIGGTIAKSKTYSFVVERSLTGGAELPDPVRDWKDGIEAALAEKIDRPAGGEVGDVLTKTEDGEEWKPGGSGDAVQYVPQELSEAQQKQARENIGVINADWNQNDDTKADYIKNRGAYQYSEKQIKSEVFISGNNTNGEIVEIPDENNSFLKKLKNYVELFGDMPWIGCTPALEINYEFTINNYTGKSGLIDYFNPQKFVEIGGSNRKVSTKYGHAVYFILDVSALDDEHAGKFSKEGIYGSYDESKDLNKNKKLSYIIKLTYQRMWNEKFIPSNIERATRKVTDISQWSGRDDFYPSVAAVEKYVDAKAGSNLSLGIASAQIGQIAKITAVDDSGVPTEWEAVDFVSAGGGSNKFRLIADMTLTEQSDKVVITTDIDGNPFELSEVYCIVIAQSYEDVEGGCTFLPNNRWLAGDAYVDSGYKTPKASEDWKQQMVFHAVAGDGLIVANQMARKSNNNIIDTKVAAGQTLITSIGIAGKMAVGSTIRLLGRDAKTEAAGEKWELIGSQTVQEEVQGITITAPAGKSYKSILIVDDMPQASANGSIDLKANGETIQICTNFMTSGTMVYTRKRAYLFSIVDTNVVGIISLGTQNQIGYGKNAEFGWKGYTKGPITTISYNAFPPGNVLLPVGTKISVWGK